MHTHRSIAISAALEAGRTLRRYYQNVGTVTYKGEIDIVTEADQTAENAIISRLQGAFPEYGILAEESGVHESTSGTTRKWIIDPLDGTTNFANGYPHFCVSIALEQEGEVVLGVIYEPNRDELFIAEAGAGVYVNGVRSRVSETSDLIRSVVSTGFQYDRDERASNLNRFAHFTHETRAVRRDGSAALDLCYVAVGRFDGYWEAGIKPWDAAAASLMVREGGGTITDFTGNAFRVDSPSCVASNGVLHHDLLSGIRRSGGKAGVG